MKGRKRQSKQSAEAAGEGLPKLDPEVDLSAIQLVSPETTKEEILSLYLKVY